MDELIVMNMVILAISAGNLFALINIYHLILTEKRTKND